MTLNVLKLNLKFHLKQQNRYFFIIFTYTNFIMKQILCTKLENKKQKKKNWFVFQFCFSLCIVSFLIFFGLFYYYDLTKKEKKSYNLINNYSIYRLYSDSNQEQNTANEENLNGLFGIIEIPKINLYYPVFSTLSEDLLKIAPCKFYGETPDKNGNICIAGHNYHNSTFFSKLSLLEKNDEINIFDNNGNKYIYIIYDIYEVQASDFSPVFNYPKNRKIISLFTCDEFGKNRIVVKAKQKSF